MASQTKITDIQLETAWSAVKYAQEVRAYHRRTTEKGSKARENDIEIALSRITRSMKPVRSYLGRARFLEEAAADKVEMARQASHALQSERRKLWKMQSPERRKARKEAEA